MYRYNKAACHAFMNTAVLEKGVNMVGLYKLNPFDP